MPNQQKVETKQKTFIDTKTGILIVVGFALAMGFVFFGVLLSLSKETEEVTVLQPLTVDVVYDGEFDINRIGVDFKNTFTIPKEGILDKDHVNLNSINQKEYILDFKERIIGLSITGDFNLKSKDSYARAILVDKTGMEYLIFQAGFPFEDEKDFDGVCEETCMLDPVSVEKIIIESSKEESFIEIKNIEYVLESQRFTKEISKDQLKNAQVELKIKEINSKNLGWIAGDSPACRASYEKKKKLFGGGEFGNTYGFECYKEGIFNSDAKGSDDSTREGETILFNWGDRNGENWLSPVKDQLSCGSCWAFSAVGAVEAKINTYYNQHLDLNLSEQELVSCCTECGSCDGGYTFNAMNHVRNRGIVDEPCFPYSNSDESCNLCDGSDERKWKILDYNNYQLEESKEIIIKSKLIEEGPLAMDIFNHPILGNHSIVLTGYGYDENGPFWIIKNSWGDVWGEGGYGKIRFRPLYFLFNTQLYSSGEPLLPTGESYDRICADGDNDGYCYWGTGAKPNTCPVCSDISDVDDTNPNIFEWEDQEIYCGEYPLADGGEDYSFTTYYEGRGEGCCGDEEGEFYSNGGCCNSIYAEFDGADCVLNPELKLLVGTSNPPIQELETLEVDYGETVYFNVEATGLGQPDGVCNGCTYLWTINGVSVSSEATYAQEMEEFDENLVEIIVTAPSGSQNKASVLVLNGVKNVTTHNNFWQASPKIYENKIIFEEMPGSILDTQISLYDIDEEANMGPVYDEAETQKYPSIFNDKVIWINFYNSVISFFDFVTGEKEVLFSGGKYRGAKIYGNNVVLQEESDPYKYYIKNYDIESGIGFDVMGPDAGGRIGGHAIYNNKIVWSDSGLKLCDLNLNGNPGGCYAGDTKITLPVEPGDNPDIFEDNIVYSRYPGSDKKESDIYFYDLTQGVETQITNVKNQNGPSIYDKCIVWQGSENEEEKDIYLYNIKTEETSRITNNVYDQVYPQIYNGYVVWQDQRNADADIYMAFVPECFCENTVEICDGIDNDCDGIIDNGDEDNDGFSVCQDCNDNDPNINPGVKENCENNIDDNCDGAVDGSDDDCNCIAKGGVCVQISPPKYVCPSDKPYEYNTPDLWCSGAQTCCSNISPRIN